MDSEHFISDKPILFSGEDAFQRRKLITRDKINQVKQMLDLNHLELGTCLIEIVLPNETRRNFKIEKI
ncbi:MAG: hypothetical protein ACO1O6_10255 [Bacteroidota bacterium]